jgi:hypothetical protein
MVNFSTRFDEKTEALFFQPAKLQMARAKVIDTATGDLYYITSKLRTGKYVATVIKQGAKSFTAALEVDKQFLPADIVPNGDNGKALVPIELPGLVMAVVLAELAEKFFG